MEDQLMQEPLWNAMVTVMKSGVRKMAPLPTGTAIRTDRIPGIKAVIFDIYGTLIISRMGDIALGDGDGNPEATETLAGFIDRFNVRLGMRELADAFRAEVGRVHAEMRIHEPYPEIVAEELWSRILDLSRDDATLFAAAWESCVNTVCEMPGAAQTLERLLKAGFRLGIISNAQVYTPPLFPVLLGKSIQEFGFDPDLLQFSWKARTGKPGRKLFDAMVSSLQVKGIEPHEALFVGNDMLKDMYPARTSGMKTCLFAGDARSLKLRRDDERCLFEPDAVITSLSQLQEVVGCI